MLSAYLSLVRKSSLAVLDGARAGISSVLQPAIAAQPLEREEEDDSVSPVADMGLKPGARRCVRLMRLILRWTCLSTLPMCARTALRSCSSESLHAPALHGCPYGCTLLCSVHTLISHDFLANPSHSPILSPHKRALTPSTPTAEGRSPKRARNDGGGTPTPGVSLTLLDFGLSSSPRASRK